MSGATSISIRWTPQGGDGVVASEPRRSADEAAVSVGRKCPVRHLGTPPSRTLQSPTRHPHGNHQTDH